MTTAKAGTLLLIDSGQWSDYSVIGFFVVLEEFDPAAKLAEFLAAHPEQNEDFFFEKEGFLATLLKAGLLLEVEHGNLYLGAYRGHEEIRFTPVGEFDPREDS
jgi:hypothetical protein